jgi:hypothetical protein
VGDLNTISNALMLHMVRSNVIPSETTWAGAAANWFTRPASQILTNNRGYARLFFYDSGGWLNGKLPYTNGVAGAGVSAPSGARVAIVSTIATALPYANGALSTADFNSLWNATPGATPSYLTSHGWTGSGDDLVIQRINLDPLFHHLVLTTRDSSTTAGYSINSSSSSNAVPNTPSGLNSYYFDGTTVGLWSGVTLTNRFLLTRDISYTFDGGMWQAQLTGASQDNGAVATNFAYQAGLFIHTDNVPGGHQGASAQSLLSAFYGFMYGYTVWANECPHFQNNASSPGQQTDYQFLNALGAQSGIIDATAGSSGGGLLK